MTTASVVLFVGLTACGGGAPCEVQGFEAIVWESAARAGGKSMAI